MIYYDLGIPARSLLILAFFAAVCIGGWVMLFVFTRKNAVHRLLAPACLIGSAAMMVVYTAEARSKLRDLALPPASAWLCEKPLLLSVGWLLMVSVYFGWLLLEDWRFRRNTITRSSIKEGLDKISSGLCFSAEGGRVILVNRRMNELSHMMIGQELQNAELFWKTLSGGEVKEGVERISGGGYPGYRLPDGTVWTFARKELDGFIQLTAADTTLQQSLTDELYEKNLELEAMNLRLRRHGENVDELTRAKERLETKVRIHGELGHALLMTRRYLVSPSNQEPPLDVWRRNTAMLRQEMEAQREEDPLQILRKAARFAGVELKISGSLPEKTEYRQFFLTAASEAMTNAVVHANAKQLRIELGSDGIRWRMRFTNDGSKPDKPVAEGGGLSSLRRKAEYIGAAMTVESAPEFAMTIEGAERKTDD